MITAPLPKLKLLTVTKGKSVSQVAECLRQNPQLFRIGENRVDEAEFKFAGLKVELGADYLRLEKHFIGKLQSRKIKDVARLFEVVQSVENLEQAQKLSAAAGKLGKTLRVYLEVNLSGLSGRSGVKPEEAESLKNVLAELPHLSLEGVMGMATLGNEARAQFKILKSLQGDLAECSMGMSQDYPIAIEEGATMLRLGTVLFEEGLPKSVTFE